jgi:alpha-1,3/alpha-1,6-mannosyltransferase
VRGNTIIPSSILSRFSILCAILRQLHLILQIFFTLELDELKPDAFFVDQLSAGLPVLRYSIATSRISYWHKAGQNGGREHTDYRLIYWRNGV